MTLEDIAEQILDNASLDRSIHYLMDDLQTALDERKQTIDLERGFLEQLYEAAEQSEWVPCEYYMNDWISDTCEFLRTGRGIHDV